MVAKKLQVFVSSTYVDLRAERQAVVEAILAAGHIPAGMELFAAGDKSQLETIRQWIRESDVFMLVLGGRYGSIDVESQKSYIEIEYEYAIELNKPVFAAVISDKCLDEKVRKEGKSVLETEHPDAYRRLKNVVLGKVCKFFDDTKDLKLIVHESIPEVARGRELAGWLRGSDVADPNKTLEQMTHLQSENTRLSKRVADLERKLATDLYGGYSFDELLAVLQDERVSLGGSPDTADTKDVPLLNAFLAYADELVVGVANFVNMNARSHYIFFRLAPKLATYSLVEKESVNDTGVQRFQTSALGNRFLAKVKPMIPMLHPDGKDREGDVSNRQEHVAKRLKVRSAKRSKR